MLAVRWHARGAVRVDKVPPPPPPRPGEVQLRVGWGGICGTDVEEWLSGPLFIPVDAPHPITGARAPMILGHEFAGRVVAVGDGVAETPDGPAGRGERIYVLSGSMPLVPARRGHPLPAAWPAGLHGDGRPCRNCVTHRPDVALPLPDTVADDEAPLVETLAVAVRALRRGMLRPGEQVAVVGAGAVGLMAVQAARAFGAGSVAVVEPLAGRRSLGLPAWAPPGRAAGGRGGAPGRCRRGVGNCRPSRTP